MSKGRANYHHGDLRKAVLERTRTIIDKDGVDSFSIRSLAAEVGVAHRAIYNHFADKDSLLSSLAAVGFKELAGDLGVVDNSEQYIRTYAGFALNNRHLYTIMMNRSYAQYENLPELRASADLMIAVSIKILAPNDGSDTEKRRSVMRYWMLVHGGVSLHSSGALFARTDDEFIDELLIIAGQRTESSDPPSQPLWEAPTEELK
jgi:AcrR family transcriptional regulator